MSFKVYPFKCSLYFTRILKKNVSKSRLFPTKDHESSCEKLNTDLHISLFLICLGPKMRSMSKCQFEEMMRSKFDNIIDKAPEEARNLCRGAVFELVSKLMDRPAVQCK